MLFTDMILLPLALYLAFALRFSYFSLSFITQDLALFVLIILFALLIFYYFGTYKTIIRFITLEFATKILQATLVVTLVFFAAISLFNLNVPRSIPIIFAILAGFFTLLSRISVYVIFKKINETIHNRVPVAIYGAGGAGIQLAAALDKGKEFFVQAFFDDDINLKKTNLNGILVYPRAKIPYLVKTFKIQRILLAMPSIAEHERLKIINHLSSLSLGISIDTIPSMPEIVTGIASIDKLRSLEITDLLGRGEVLAKQELLSIAIKDKNILITGAGGTIGGQLCREILKLKPQKLILFELNEFALYAIEKELREIQASLLGNKVEIYPILGNILQKNNVDRVLEHFKIHTIYHAAAYKHVPMVEYNVFAGLRNNVIGTKILAESAITYNVERFILISTDKAVRPTNIMGASKRWAELILQDKALSQNSTCFAMVRFGNVLGSSGSVVPLFTKQIQAGGPVTLTHKDIIRYFMTISEAALLVIQAGGMAQGGEVFLLDMGEPVKIYDLAKKMIELSGFSLKDTQNPQGDIEILITGLRPGEKLYEELLLSDTNFPTEHEKIKRGQEETKDSTLLEESLKALENAELTEDYQVVLDILNKLVDGFNHENQVKDCITWTKNTLL